MTLMYLEREANEGRDRQHLHTHATARHAGESGWAEVERSPPKRFEDERLLVSRPEDLELRQTEPVE